MEGASRKQVIAPLQNLEIALTAYRIEIGSQTLRRRGFVDSPKPALWGLITGSSSVETAVK